MRNDAADGQKAVTIEVLTANGGPAIGAAVYVTAANGDESRHEVRTSGSYGAASTHLLHLAAGATGKLRYRVVWADGSEGPAGTAPSGGRTVLRAGS